MRPARRAAAWTADHSRPAREGPRPQARRWARLRRRRVPIRPLPPLGGAEKRPPRARNAAGAARRSSPGRSVPRAPGPAGDGPDGTTTLRPRRPAGAAPRVPNPPPAAGGNAGGSMSPAPVSHRWPRGARGSCRLGQTFKPFLLTPCRSLLTNQRLQLLAVDHSACASMKNAASCEK